MGIWPSLLLLGAGGWGCGDKADPGNGAGPGLLDSGESAVDMAGCREWLASGQVPAIETGCTVSTEDWRENFLAAGGSIFPVGAGRYYGVWLPSDWQRGDPLLFAVHNTDGCAELIFDYWLHVGKTYGMVLLQYRSAGEVDFDSEEVIYANLSAAHAEVGEHCPIGPSAKAYYGYSRGGGRAYGVSVLDTAGLDFLDAYIVDSGVVPSLYSYPQESMTGTRYWMWCGERDVDPIDASQTMCETMAGEMVAGIQDLGGQVDAITQEPGACHGMFFFDCDESCANCSRRDPEHLGESLPQLFDYIDSL